MTDSTSISETAGKLRVFATASGTYREVLGQPGRLARALAVPLGLAFALSMVSRWAAWNLPDAAIPLSFMALLPYLIFALVWHRGTLLDQGASRLRRSVTPRRFCIFTGYAALMAALLALPVLLHFFVFFGSYHIAFPPWVNSIFSQTGAALTALACILLIYPAMRLSLVFPAVAIDQELGLKGSWRLTANQGPRLFATTLLTGLPVAFVLGALFVFTTAVETSLNRLPLDADGKPPFWIGVVVIAFLAAVIQLVCFAVMITVSSQAYRHLTGRAGLSRKETVGRFE